VRADNLNTINPSEGFKFTARNFTAPYYPARAFWFRLGIWWSFVN